MGGVFSAVDIANRALQMVGAQAIGSLTDGTKNAREASRCYDSLRQSLLRMKPWNFATVFASLAQVLGPTNAAGANSIWGSASVYNLPADYIRLIAVSPFSGGWLYDGYTFQCPADYLLQNGTIITWVSAPLNIRYVQDFTNVAQMDPLFREALAYYMATELCEILTQSNTKKQALASGLKAVMDQAALTNAFDKPAQETPTDLWLTVRA